MTPVLEVTAPVASPVLSTPATNGAAVSEAEAECLVRRYVDAHLDPTFTVAADHVSNRQAASPVRAVWRFFVGCAEGPLNVIEVDKRNGQFQPFSETEIRLMREKAAIYAARGQGVLPVDERGVVLGEYARRQASRYLDDNLSMYYSGVDPLLIPGEPSLWQVTITFKRNMVGPLTLGVMDVDAATGEPIPLSTEQINHIRERTRAIIRHQTQTTDAG